MQFDATSLDAFMLQRHINRQQWIDDTEEESSQDTMAYGSSRSVRFYDDLEAAKPTKCNSNNSSKHAYNIYGAWKRKSGSRICREKPCRSFKEKLLSRVFSEDYESLMDVEKFLDPHGRIIHRWNKTFLVACLVSLFLDPLFFYLPGTQKTGCTEIDIPLEVALTVLRSLADVFYAVQIFIRYRTAFVAPSSRVFGRGELVIDSYKIASRYLSRGFCLDLFAALPLPQFLLWIVIPSLKGSTMVHTKNLLRFSIILQYLPRLFLIFPLSKQIIKTTGVMTETAWAGAAYNLVLYMLASHVLGACWYLLSIERQEACWREACHLESPSCRYQYFDCRSIGNSRNSWHQSSNLTDLCDPNKNLYQFGIYADALIFNVTSSPFLRKYFYCFWWGLKNLSCLGQNLSTSTYVGENSFAIIIAILGLLLFGLLIGNMQSYLQATMVRLEEWRIKRTDTEQWMRHRQLPPELKQSIRRYQEHIWVATQGVDEEELLQGLPMDLRRDIKRHLCLDLVRRVPLFDQMDDRMLDAICERLKPALYTHGTYLVHELDPVNEMLFIIRGYLDSTTTNGGRSGFFNCCRLGPGEFCGEELLTWALDPRPAAFLPSSTRTVQAVTEVEAFALVADDLKFVASQFRRLHSKQLRHTFRFYSHQWRTWATCFIQAAWRRHKRQRPSSEVPLDEAAEELMASRGAPEPGAEAAVLVARFVASKRREGGEASLVPDRGLRKPSEPDFSVEEEN